MKLRIYLIISLVFLASFGMIVAADEGYKISVGIPGMTGFAPGVYATSPAAYIKSIYNFSLGLGALLALGMIVYGALEYTISAGNTTRQSDAKDRITQAIYGLVLLLGSILILNTINPKIPQLELPTLTSVPPIALRNTSWLDAVHEFNNSVQAQTEADRALVTAQGEFNRAHDEFVAVQNRPANDPERLRAELKVAQTDVQVQQAKVAAIAADLDGDTKAAIVNLNGDDCEDFRSYRSEVVQSFISWGSLINLPYTTANTAAEACQNRLQSLAQAHETKIRNYNTANAALNTARTNLNNAQARQATAAPATTTPQ